MGSGLDAVGESVEHELTNMDDANAAITAPSVLARQDAGRGAPGSGMVTANPLAVLTA